MHSMETCRLFISDDSSGERRTFSVLRGLGGRVQRAMTVELADPAVVPVRGSPNSLLEELRWYLENYCDYPWSPNKERAERLLQELRTWGTQIFEQLFGNGMAAEWYRSAVSGGHKSLELTVSSDDPAVHAWPWEAMFESRVGTIAHQCKIDRQLNSLPDPPAIARSLPQGPLQVLMITARPFSSDVDYCGISRRVLEVTEAYPGVQVKLLRPPTFDALRRELAANAGKYHIIHFDGHGQFSERERQGGLAFEDGSGDPHLVFGHQLSRVLREYQVPTVVLNACQSGNFGASPDDPFASVATSLLQAGIRSVLSMSYSIYVKAAQLFLPAFYERILLEGDVAEAVRAGRQALAATPEREWGFNLEDWLVPTLYQNHPVALPKNVSVGAENRDARAFNTFTLVGRDNYILELDRACRRRAAVIVLKGLSGVGKTTIASAYIDWVKRTNARIGKTILISLKLSNSFDRLIARLFEECCSTERKAETAEEEYRAVVGRLRVSTFLVVLDNFDLSTDAVLADDGADDNEEQKFRSFAEALDGGATKIIITTRVDVSWLKPSYKLAVQGLQGPDRARLAEEILKEHGLSVLSYGAAAHALADFLLGHPLMMRVMLPKLSESSVESLIKSLKNTFDLLDGDNRLQVVLSNIESFLPQYSEPELFLLKLHVAYARTDYMVGICADAMVDRSDVEIESTLRILERFGVVHQLDKWTFELHPALSAYLQTRKCALQESVAVKLRRAFAHGMAKMANYAATQPLHHQRAFFKFSEGSVRRALDIAKESGDFESSETISIALGTYQGWLRNKRHAETIIDDVIVEAQSRNDMESQTGALLIQGKISQQGYDYKKARVLFQKALSLAEISKDELARTQLLRALGGLEREVGNLKEAKAYFSCCIKSAQRHLGVKELASFYYDLGMLAIERGLDVLAKRWFSKTMKIAEAADNLHAIGATSVQLAYLAKKQGDLRSAKVFLQRAHKINQTLGDEYSRSVILSELAGIAENEHDAMSAERLYTESLRICEKIRDEKGIAVMTFRLGDVALMRQDFVSAARWFERCLSSDEQYRRNLTVNAELRLNDCYKVIKGIQ